MALNHHKIFIISGEASGDLHGANLIKAMREIHPHLEIKGWGGDLMEEQGMVLLEHYKNLAFMGFTEVLMNIRTILTNFKRCKAQIANFQPDAVIFIDYPGFNLRMAKFAKESGILSLYYISPTIWAWKENRVHKIKAYVDEMYTILPFEARFYEKFDSEVNFVGHPLLDVVSTDFNADEFRTKNNLSSAPIIAVLPGSRTQEIERMLSIMLEASEDFPAYQIVIAGAPSKDISAYEKFLSEKVHLVFGQTYDLFHAAEAGWVTSGTATLEAAIHNMPQVVVYKAGTISYQIARRLVKVKYISLVNLIMDKELVTELIQGEATAANLISEMKLILKSGSKRNKLLTEYEELNHALGHEGASKKAATHMLKTLADSK